MIGDDGNTYEGRGLHFRGEIITNSSEIEVGLIVAFIGTFDDRPPSQRQVTVFHALLDSLQSRGLLVEKYSMISEDQLTNSNISSGVFDVIGGSDRYYPRKCSNVKMFLKMTNYLQ